MKGREAIDRTVTEGKSVTRHTSHTNSPLRLNIRAPYTPHVPYVRHPTLYSLYEKVDSVT